MYKHLALAALTGMLINTVEPVLNNRLVTNLYWNLLFFDPLVLSIFIIFVILVAPLIEELIFRKGLWALADKIPVPGVAPIITALLFTFAHGIYLGIWLLPITCQLTYLRWKKANIWELAATHGMFNTSAVITTMLLSWYQWS